MIYTVFIVISAVLTLAAVYPYIRDVLKHKTKPRVVSWFNWALLAGIASLASFSDHQTAAGVMSMCDSLECLLIAILGWHNGDKHFQGVDYFSQVGVIVALGLWWIYNSPAVAVAAAVTIDLIASIPTIKHAWEKPFEETWSLFLMSGLAAIFTIMAAQHIRITSLANPVYIAFINFLIMTIILRQRKVSA